MKTTGFRVAAILLDLDGTVVDSKKAYFEAARTACQALGRKVPDLKTALEIPRRLEQQQPLGNIVGTKTKQFLDIYLKTFYKVTLEKTRPFPNMGETLRDLSLKSKLALITMRFVPQTEVATELKHSGLAAYFSCFVTALDTPTPKPSPEALIKAAELLDAEPRDCIVVGDSVVDVRAGRAAGIKTVSVLSGLFSRRELAREEPNLVLKNLADLVRYVEAR